MTISSSDSLPIFRLLLLGCEREVVCLVLVSRDDVVVFVHGCLRWWKMMRLKMLMMVVCLHQ